MKIILAALLMLAVSGCVSIAKVETGDRSIGDRLLVTLDGPWNRINAPNLGPAETWTMEGLPVDQLLIYSGIKNSQAIHAERTTGNSQQKNFSFRSNMQPDEIVTMFEGMLTRDGSRFKLVKLEPVSFGGSKGFRFYYSLTRKIDNAQLSGVGYGTVSKGELFAIVYTAPQLAFYPRHVARVEELCRSARVKDL
jgi:hypothetical protein